MIAADSGTLTTVVVVLLGGGLVTAIGGVIYQMRKVKPETDQIRVSTSGDMIVIQREAYQEIIGTLRTEVDRLTKRVEEFAGVQHRLMQLQEENSRLDASLVASNRDRDSLRKRVAHLESEVRELKNGH